MDVWVLKSVGSIAQPNLFLYFMKFEMKFKGQSRSPLSQLIVPINIRFL